MMGAMALTTASRLAHLERDTAAFGAVLDRAVAQPALLGAPVDACPGWTLTTLAHHLGEVHRWVCDAIREGHGRTRVTDPPIHPEALARWFADGASNLLSQLDADPETPAWTFHQPATIGFWQRRQPQENLVHRWDAEAAVGRPGPVDPELAAEGIDEILDVFVPRRLSRGLLDPFPHAVRLRGTDVDSSWVLGTGSPVAEVAGPAAVLLLRLWKRVGAEHPDLRWSGDRPAGEQVLAMPVSA